MQDADIAIWPPYEIFYIHSMLFNTTSAVASISLLGEVMEHLEGNSPSSLRDIDTDDVLNHLQNIVLQGAALSRYFWPVREGHERRAEKFRSSLGVTDNNPLRNRDLRNAMEHFDERLDRYLSKGIVGNIIPQYVGPSPKSAGVPRHTFRSYYIDLGVFELLGDRYEIEPIAKELWRLHDALAKCDQHGGRL
jgi:hypothetical protein